MEKAISKRIALVPFTPMLLLTVFLIINHRATSLAGEISPEVTLKVATALVMLTSSTPSETWEHAKRLSVSEISKKRYSLEGQLVKLSGVVYQIQQQPPFESIQGDWYEMLLMADNPNSALGLTTVDLVYVGDASKVEPKTKISFAGYFVGFQEGENAVGGKVESLIVVSNAISTTRTRAPSTRTRTNQPPLIGLDVPAKAPANPPVEPTKTKASQKPPKNLPNQTGKIDAHESPNTPDYQRPTTTQVIDILNNK